MVINSPNNLPLWHYSNFNNCYGFNYNNYTPYNTFGSVTNFTQNNYDSSYNNNTPSNFQYEDKNLAKLLGYESSQTKSKTGATAETTTKTEVGATTTTTSSTETTLNAENIPNTTDNSTSIDNEKQKTPTLAKLSKGEKITRGLMNGLQGIGNTLKSFVGYQEDGSWNFKKCIRNVGIAAGVATLCYFAPPLGASLAAKLGGGAVATLAGSAIAHIPATLVVGGAVSGTAMVAKSLYKTGAADTLEEFDKATQDLGQGIFITGASIAGCKGINKSAGVKGINPFKGCSSNYQVAQDAIRVNGSGFQGMKAANTAIKNKTIDINKSQFETQYSNTVSKLQNQIKNINKSIKNTSGEEKTILQLKKDLLYEKLLTLNKANNRTTWSKIGEKTLSNKNIKWYHTGNKKISVRGKEYNASQIRKAAKQIEKESNGITKDLTALRKARYNTMKEMANSDTFKQEVQDFGYSTSWFKTPVNWYYSIKDTGIKKMDMVNVGFLALDPIFALQPLSKKAYIMPLNTLACVDPAREKAETTDLVA